MQTTTHGPAASAVSDPAYRRMVDFLVGLGTDDVPHTGDHAFLAHLIEVYGDMKLWGCGEDVCRAGLFHSIYGTQRFQKFCLPLERRGEVRELIGERAERLAYVNCVMVRESFDENVNSTGPYRLRNRIDGQPIELSREDFDDLCRVHLCDWLEQVPRSKEWNYRRDSYRRMARRLGSVAEETHLRTYAQE